MRQLVVSLALFLSSCATPTGKVAIGVAGVSTAIGVIAITAPCDDDECATTDAVNGVLFFGVAGVALVTAVIAEATAR